jgi:hypothetical protein
MTAAKAIFWFGFVGLCAWTAYAGFIAFLSPLYTVGGVDEGWWLVAFLWLCTALATVALFVSLRLNKSDKVMPATVLVWSTPIASYALWIGFYIFYNSVLLHCDGPCGGVSLPG